MYKTYIKTNNNKNEHPHTLHSAEETDYLCLRKGEWTEGSIAFKITSLSWFLCSLYPLAFFFLIFKNSFTFNCASPDNILFSFALIGELYRNGTIRSILFGDLLLSLSTYVLEIHPHWCVALITVVHVLARLWRIALCGSPLCLFPSPGLFLYWLLGKQYGHQIQQVNLPFKASEFGPFLVKFPESAWGISKWFAFICGNTACPHFGRPSREWTCFAFSRGC